MTSSVPRHLTLIAGARPNFMKIAPLIRALETHAQRHPDRALRYSLIHTGQHYDHEMSQSFFDDLGIPAPAHNLGVGSGSQAEQTGRIMIAFEQLLLREPTGMVVVVGDVNSTLACAIVAKKLCLPVAHVEAGLRSFDMAMPEEINRIVTDRLSDIFFTTDPTAGEHLRREGARPEAIHEVGNVMIDTLFYNLERARQVTRFAALKQQGPYGVLTLHRPSNVDDPETFRRLTRALEAVAAEVPLVFARHPRTADRMARFDLSFSSAVTVLPPLPYLEMLNLVADAKLVLTDSGGLQEETTALGIPCITLRENTERPVTVAEGTNQIVGTAPDRIQEAFAAVMAGRVQRNQRPALWDGEAAARIVDLLDRWFTSA